MQDTAKQYEAAKKLAQELQARIERSAGRLDAARRQYADLVSKMKSLYGVDSVEALEAMIASADAENQRMLRDFFSKSESVKADLDVIEKALDEANI